MTWTFNSKAFTADGQTANAVQYAGPAQTLSLKDQLRVARTAPKPTSTFSGVGRTQVKLVRTLTLTGALTPTHEGIIDLSMSMPVGFTGADVDAMVNDFAAAVAHANFKTIAKNLLITY